MKYMLDTNICIYIIKQNPKSVVQKLASCNSNDVCISSITESELWFGVFNSQQIEKNRAALLMFLASLNVLPYDSSASVKYGEIRSLLQKRGNLIGQMDILISAHALSQNLTLVTNNTKEFKRIKQLSVTNWV